MDMEAKAEDEKVLVGAAKVAHDKKLGVKALRPYPFQDGGVNENAAIRMIKMVIPICPADPNPEILKRDGTSVPNPRYTGEENCQQIFKINNEGRWDVDKCIARGHDPYHTTFRKTIVEDVVGEDGYVIETKTRVKSEKRLNVIQVSDNVRHSTKMEVALALARGCKFLEDFGIEAPCEFRNCVKPVKVDTRYGKFCSERHARLVGADARQIFLLVGGDPYTQDKALEEREQTLENINIRKGG
jgi:hypothetical protein